MHLRTQRSQAALVLGAAETAPPSRWQEIWRSPAWMVLVGFAVRVLWIALAHTYRFRTTEANFGFGLEIGRLAYSLANGHGFSSPFGGDTGPSAWNAPVYPWILSLAFRMFGSYSHAAAFAMLVFNSIFAALTSWTIYRTARRVFNETVAIWSGWIWALFPDTIFWSVRWIWETSLSAFLLSLLFMLTVEMEGDERASSWIGYGLLWGVAALSNPAALSFLPFAGCWLVYQLHRRGRAFCEASRPKRGCFLDDHHAVAGAQLRGVRQARFHPRQLRQRAAHRQQPAGRGPYVLAYHPSQYDLHTGKIQADGRDGVSRRPGTAGEGVDRTKSRPLRGAHLRRVVYFWNGLPRLSKIQGLSETKNSLFLATSIVANLGTAAGR